MQVIAVRIHSALHLKMVSDPYEDDVAPQRHFRQDDETCLRGVPKMRSAFFPILLFFGTAAAVAQQSAPAPSVPVKVSKVVGNLYLLQGDRGGNIIVSIGDDGVFMIDTQTE